MNANFSHLAVEGRFYRLFLNRRIVQFSIPTNCPNCNHYIGYVDWDGIQRCPNKKCRFAHQIHSPEFVQLWEVMSAAQKLDAQALLKGYRVQEWAMRGTLYLVVLAKNGEVVFKCDSGNDSAYFLVDQWLIKVPWLSPYEAEKFVYSQFTD